MSRAPFELTNREREVLVLITQGYSTKEIAARLGITFKTAAAHRSRLMEKLGVHDVISLVRAAIQNSWVPPYLIELDSTLETASVSELLTSAREHLDTAVKLKDNERVRQHVDKILQIMTTVKLKLHRDPNLSQKD